MDEANLSILHVLQAATLPDPRRFRHVLPGSYWRRWEAGVLNREELWAELERLLGPNEVRQIVSRWSA